MKRITEKLEYWWENVKAFFYIDEHDAIDCGMTHEARVWWLPAYVKNPHLQDFDVVFKSPCLCYLTAVPEFLVGVALYIVPEDYYFETPLKIVRMLPQPIFGDIVRRN